MNTTRMAMDGMEPDDYRKLGRSTPTELHEERMKKARAAFWSTPERSPDAIENAVAAYLGDDHIYVVDKEWLSTVDWETGGTLTALIKSGALVKINGGDS